MGVPRPARVERTDQETVKLQLLPSSFDEGGQASVRQHLATFVIDDRVAIDAGSLGPAANDVQRQNIRDVVLTHAHLDHIAGLPLFLDDLFSELNEPVRIHARRSVIDVLEEHIFNWQVYPRFSELSNGNSPIIEYVELETGVINRIAHLNVLPVSVNHVVPSTGFIISDERTTVAFTGDTFEMDVFWDHVNAIQNLSALLIECAFPNRLTDLAKTSGHMTPQRLLAELAKFKLPDCPIYAINVKPSYREETIAELQALDIANLRMLDVVRIYDF